MEEGKEEKVSPIPQVRNWQAKFCEILFTNRLRPAQAKQEICNKFTQLCLHEAELTNIHRFIRLGQLYSAGMTSLLTEGLH